ncbi:MAG TPA: CPBP family intramembrane glutamic endopeptidase [Pyrinomonadaceae bacterium]|nr:CPBP family intramembrane glutamic endopeptidase [Pyrinomonadaceae bacterium]
MTVLSIVATIPAAIALITVILAKVEVPKAPLPLLILVGAIQNLSLLAVIIGLGLKLSRSLGLGAPLLESLTRGERTTGTRGKLLTGLLAGLVVGIILVLLLFALVSRLPNLPFVLAARLPFWKRFLFCFYGGVYEEVFTRLFLLTLIAWIANRTWRKATGELSSAAFWFANFLSAVLFGLGHLPAASLFLQITPLVVVVAIILNGIAGMTFGYLYRRNGLESAMVAHFTADFVIWVLGASLLRAG